MIEQTEQEQQRLLKGASRTLARIMRKYKEDEGKGGEDEESRVIPTGLQDDTQHPAVNLYVVGPVRKGQKALRQSRAASEKQASARAERFEKAKERVDKFDKQVKGKKVYTDTEDSEDSSYRTSDVSDRSTLRSKQPLASARSEPFLFQEQNTALMQIYDRFSTHEHA